MHHRCCSTGESEPDAQRCLVSGHGHGRCSRLIGYTRETQIGWSGKFVLFGIAAIRLCLIFSESRLPILPRESDVPIV